MKRKILKSLCSLVVTGALMASMCVNVFAFKYPSAYWKLHDAWAAAVQAEDVEEVLSVAQKTYDLLIKSGLCADVCYNLEPKCAKAAWCAEMKGDIPGAIQWLERQRVFAQWLDQNEHDYQDALLNIEARLDHLNAAVQPVIYALSDDGPNPYSGGPSRGVWNGAAVDGSRSGQSAVLMYVDFMDGYSVEYWIDYYKRTYPKFAQAVEENGVIELAWNFSPENTSGVQRVLDPSADSYVADGLRALGQLKATVLLRVGAEMNNWAECDSAKFIQAFRKVADQARAYGNIQMVFSPSTVDNRNVDMEDFYPGDQYVDWVGMSAYQNNTTPQTTAYTFGAVGYDNDAYYARGLYASDPLIQLSEVARLAEKHNKPMMVSECGFSHTGPAGGDQTAYAADQLNRFYSYVTMVYPRVRAVFYFDKDMAGSTYRYALAGNPTLAATYESAVAGNGSYLAQGQTAALNWEEFSKTSIQADGKLKLAVYASFPGNAATTVRYWLDGKLYSQPAGVPYSLELNTAGLTPGKHTLWATATSGQFSTQSKSYEFYVSQSGMVMAAGETKGFQISAASGWAQGLLMDAYDKGLVTARTGSGFQNQITRLQFAELAVNLIERATGQTLPVSDQTFADTSDTVVRKAVAAGVTSGKGPNSFAPNDKITRQEICVMLNKVIQYVDQAKGSNTLTNTSTQLDAKFTDGSSIDSWAAGPVALLTNNGLMSGKDGGRVAPKDNTKIEEAIILILALNNKF